MLFFNQVITSFSKTNLRTVQYRIFNKIKSGMELKIILLFQLQLKLYSESNTLCRIE